MSEAHRHTLGIVLLKHAQLTPFGGLDLRKAVCREKMKGRTREKGLTLLLAPTCFQGPCPGPWHPRAGWWCLSEGTSPAGA